MERKSILVTGGAGFIGSHVVKHLVRKYPNYDILNVDALTYAGNLENLKEIANEENYFLVKVDVSDLESLFKLIQGVSSKLAGVIRLAAESHVDRSIGNPMDFVQTNIMSTVNLLDAVRAGWERHGGNQ